MNVFEFIDKIVSRKQLPYVRLITIYLNDGIVTGVCLSRYIDKKIAKKASKVGLNQDRLMITDLPPGASIGVGVKISNFNGYDIQKGSYYLNYNTSTKEIIIYRQ